MYHCTVQNVKPPAKNRDGSAGMLSTAKKPSTEGNNNSRTASNSKFEDEQQ
jgi:hypothetical protein